jgi:hypothetical protein
MAREGCGCGALIERVLHYPLVGGGQSPCSTFTVGK